MKLKLSKQLKIIPPNALTIKVAQTLTDEGIPLLVGKKTDDVGV